MKYFLVYTNEAGTEQIYVVSEKDVPAFKQECYNSKGYQVCTAAILLPNNPAVRSTWTPSYYSKKAYESGVDKALSEWNSKEKEIMNSENEITWNSAKLRWR